MSDDPTVTRLGSLKLDTAVDAPDVWDVLICGGGPCGTAAAMRAKELGLRALVIDYDDVMKRIRDYPKAKPILPTYGGGDKATFPGGGEHVQALYFDDIDKDDLVAKWKACYRAASTPARIGSELTGLDKRDDGTWDVVTWNHRGGEEIRYAAKNVIVAVGAGVPRRFDIPGDTDGIAFRLDDPANYVSKGPILVIGGGTSAAEAVIAISNAKMEAEDPCHVYWGYRGTKMPKVSKALADRFFDAYLGNGNVRYLRMSDPAMITTGPDKRDYLSLLIDRKVVDGRPVESVHYEFAKECVIACIGTDLPVSLLQRLGIKVPMVNGQPRMLITAEGETNLPGVFLAGDARGPRFLRCTDFDDQETWEKVSMKRNIKAAMNDAVQTVEFIGRRMGLEVPELPAGPVRGPSEAGAAAAAAEGGAGRTTEVAAPASPKDTAVLPVQDAPAAEAPVTPASTHPGEQTGDASSPVVSLLLPDGEVEEEFPLRGDSIDIGRVGTGIACPSEQYMADHHATLSESGGQWTITDTEHGSGVWLRVQGTDGTVLHDGDQLWVGAQILVVNRTDQWVVTHYDREGRQGQTYAVQGRGFMVGRAVDLPLDPTDMLLGRRHCQFVLDGDELRIYDRGALNGTWLRVRGSAPLDSGDEFKLATKRFRLENVAAVEKLESDAVVIDTPAEAPKAAAPAPAPAAAAAPAEATPEAPAAEEPAAAEPAAPAAAAAAGGAPGASYTGEEGSMDWPVADGQTLLEAYKAAGGGQGSPLDYDCEKGICGACAVQIAEGSEHFDPVEEGSTEMKTIQIAVGVEPDPSKYRLACLAKVRGPVKLCVPDE